MVEYTTLMLDGQVILHMDMRPSLRKLVSSEHQYWADNYYPEIPILTEKLDKFDIQYTIVNQILTFASDADHAMFLLYCGNDYNIVQGNNDGRI